MVLWEYRARVTRIVDGDNIDVGVDLGFKITKNERLRLLGVNTPEIRGSEREQGLKSKAFLEEVIPVGSWVQIRTHKTGKYGRYIAEVFYFTDDDPELRNDLGEVLIKEGLGAPYGPHYMTKELPTEE